MAKPIGNRAGVNPQLAVELMLSKTSKYELPPASKQRARGYVTRQSAMLALAILAIAACVLFALIARG